MSDIDWKDFQIGGKEGVFSIKSSISEIDKKNLNDEVGETPYVTRTDLNNGISMYVTKNQDKKYIPNKGNVISIGLDTQTIFYQPTEFYTGQNIQILSHEKMNEDIARYLIPLLKIQLSKFSWGGNGATLKRLNNSRVMLPIDEKDEPHWEYMNELGKKLYFESYEFISEYIFKKYTQLSKELIGKEIPMLNDKEWLPFRIEEIFTKIQRGKRLTKANQISGDRPYISSTALNNGVDSFIDNKKDVRISEKDITIANSGSVGNSFYHPYEYVASDHVHSLGNNKYNKYHYLFIVTLLNRLQDKYHFNYEINDKRLKSDKLMLPVTNKNELDLEFMENYIKKIEYERLLKLIEYLNLK